jgi:hypothetical protein
MVLKSTIVAALVGVARGMVGDGELLLAIGGRGTRRWCNEKWECADGFVLLGRLPG